MPLTKKGRKIMRAMKKHYGDERGEAIFYASRNAGAITGVERSSHDRHDAGRRPKRRRRRR